MKKFSAGAVKYGFWFAEFVEVLPWVVAGDDDATIKQRVLDTDVLQQRSVDRTKNVIACLLKRIHSLPKELQEIFFTLDADNQRVAVLISIMNTDRLIQAFIVDCFKDAVVLGDEILEDYELNDFFSRLQADHEEVANWQDQTISRLKGTIRNYLRASGIAKDRNNKLVLQRPLLDPRLTTILQDSDHQDYVFALTGRING